MTEPHFPAAGQAAVLTQRITKGALKLVGPLEVILTFGKLTVGEGDTSLVTCSSGNVIDFQASVSDTGGRVVRILTPMVVVDQVGRHSTMSMTF